MKKHVYIETTVVSYLTAKPSRDIMIAGHQEATRELWAKLSSRYKTYVSALVFEEAGRGDPGDLRLVSHPPEIPVMVESLAMTEGTVRGAFLELGKDRAL